MSSCSLPEFASSLPATSTATNENDEANPVPSFFLTQQTNSDQLLRNDGHPCLLSILEDAIDLLGEEQGDNETPSLGADIEELLTMLSADDDGEGSSNTNEDDSCSEDGSPATPLKE